MLNGFDLGQLFYLQFVLMFSCLQYPFFSMLCYSSGLICMLTNKRLQETIHLVR